MLRTRTTRTRPFRRLAAATEDLSTAREGPPVSGERIEFRVGGSGGIDHVRNET